MLCFCYTIYFKVSTHETEFAKIHKKIHKQKSERSFNVICKRMDMKARWRGKGRATSQRVPLWADGVYRLLSSTDSLMSWKVASISLSRPMLKRMRPSLMPISFWMSSGTSELVLLPLLLKRVLK